MADVKPDTQAHPRPPTDKHNPDAQHWLALGEYSYIIEVFYNGGIYIYSEWLSGEK